MANTRNQRRGLQRALDFSCSVSVSPVFSMFLDRLDEPPEVSVLPALFEIGAVVVFGFLHEFQVRCILERATK